MAKKPKPEPITDFPVAPPPKPPVKIERDAVEQLFGGTEGLDAAIKAYSMALAAHAKTIGIPAPIPSHAFVEIIVKQHDGKYVVVEPPAPVADPEPVVAETEPEPEPDPELDEIKEQVRRALSEVRQKKVREGVVYKGHAFYGDQSSVNAIVSTLVATEDEKNVLLRWKGKKGDFAELERVDLQVLLKVIRKRTQACFDNEYLLAKMVRGATSIKALEAIDFNAGWPE